MISSAIIEFRKNKIGGSDIPAVLGKSKFGGPASVAQRILGQAPVDGSYRAEFEFGNRWESQVAQLFAENHPEYLVVSVQDAYKTGLLGNLPGFTARIVNLPDGSVTLLDAEYDHIVLNMDYLLVSRLGLGWGVLEIKTASEYASGDWGVTGTNGFPTYYEDQPKFYAARTGANFVRGAVLIGQRDYREYHIDSYTAEEAADVIQQVECWYQQHIVGGEPVSPSLRESSDVAITDKALEASDELVALIAEHKRLNELMDDLAKKLKPIDDAVRAAGATYGAITYQGEVIFTNTSKMVEHCDSSALAREMPDLYGRFMVKSQSKRFAKAKGYKNFAVSSEEAEAETNMKEAV